MNLRFKRSDAKLCGWDNRIANESENNEDLNAEHLNNLHCMNIMLYSRDVCASYNIPGNFYGSMMCGHGEYSEEIITAVIILINLRNNVIFVAGSK